MAIPLRVQLRRIKGWCMPENTMKVDRTTKWGNPFIPGKENPFIPGQMVKDRQHAYVLYKSFALNNEKLIQAARAELAGRNLACWCPLPGKPDAEDKCHAAILIKLANDGDKNDRI